MFSPAESRLLSALHRHGDVAIGDLYRAVMERAPRNLKIRDQQMCVGRYVSRLNKKLAPLRRVVPGRARSTYRLVKGD